MAQAAVTERWLHLSSSYAKILGETNFHTREFPRSGSKAKDGGGKKKRKKERKLVITLASYALQTPGGAHKAACIVPALSAVFLLLIQQAVAFIRLRHLYI